MAYTKTDLNKSLKKFLQYNSDSKLSSKDGRAEQGLFSIEKPWGDKTLTIVIPKDAAARKSLITVLNKVWLPLNRPEFAGDF